MPADVSLPRCATSRTRSPGLGPDGRVVAHQSSTGTRLLHVYVDPTTDASARTKPAARRWPEGKAHVQASADPGWHSVAHLRT